MRKFLYAILLVSLSISVVQAQIDTTQSPARDVDDFLFDTEGLDDEEVEFDNGNSSEAMRSSEDVFSSSAAVSFNIAYFKNRGLDSRFQNTAINGVVMENLTTGRASNSQWSGLTRIFNSAKCITNLSASPFTFGDIGGSANYDVRASSFRKQLSANYTLSNGNYNHKFMLTYASGKLKNGWSVAASASARFGTQMSYVKGISYTGFAYFLSFEKRFNNRHALNFSTWGVPIKQGLQANSVPEVYELVGNYYYNRNWGWYEGKRRNARVKDTYEPVFMLTHSYLSDNKKVEINTTLASSFGHKNTTAFAFGKVSDPNPDYYRYLPSYFDDDPEMFEYYTEMWTNDEEFRQVDWDNLIATNEASALLGESSQYILENRVTQHVQVSGASTLNAHLSEHVDLYAGVDVRGYRQHNYKTVSDLLGGNFWLSRDKYADTTLNDPLLAYYDIDHADQLLVEGDKFGYDYAFNVFRENLWATVLGKFRHVDFHVGANAAVSELWRTGFMRYGAYRDNATGNSEMKVLPEYGVKAGFAVKMGKCHSLALNAQWQSAAPPASKIFVNPLYSNLFIKNIENEKDLAVDFSYIVKCKFMRMRASLYYLEFKDATDHLNFYHDLYGAFVNYTLTDIDSRHWGVELGAEFQIGKMFSIVLAGNWGDFRYTNRPQAIISANNGYAELLKGERVIEKTIYWKNYHVSGTPQVAATLGVKFKHKDWEVKVSGNYFDKIYASLNSERRTVEARGWLEEGSPELTAILTQECIRAQFTLDASISKSWKIKKSSIGLSLKVVNITNNRNLATNISEQHRFNYTTRDASAFANKCYYAQGITFNFGINYTFN